MAKLTYFNLQALGEPIRLLLAYAKIKFEDIRIDRFGKEWPEMKSDYPMGQLPLLEIDGLRIHQSKAICRYLARKCNLEGENDKERVHIDIAADVIYDFVMKMRSLREIDDPGAQLKKYDEFKSCAIPFFLRNLDDMVKNGSGHFAVGKLTWVDLYFAGSSEYLSMLARFNILEDYRHLRALVEKVFCLPQLKDYMKFRPETKF